MRPKMTVTVCLLTNLLTHKQHHLLLTAIPNVDLSTVKTYFLKIDKKPCGQVIAFFSQMNRVVLPTTQTPRLLGVGAVGGLRRGGTKLDLADNLRTPAPPLHRG